MASVVFINLLLEKKVTAAVGSMSMSNPFSGYLSHPKLPHTAISLHAATYIHTFTCIYIQKLNERRHKIKSLGRKALTMTVRAPTHSNICSRRYSQFVYKTKHNAILLYSQLHNCFVLPLNTMCKYLGNNSMSTGRFKMFNKSCMGCEIFIFKTQTTFALKVIRTPKVSFVLLVIGGFLNTSKR